MTSSPMPDELVERLVTAALKSVPREICGFVTKEWQLVFMPNVSERDDQFHIDDNALIDFYVSFPSPAGVFHSHPGGKPEPSNTDIDYAPVGMRYWIILPYQFEVVEWEMNNGRAPTRIR